LFCDLALKLNTNILNMGSFSYMVYLLNMLLATVQRQHIWTYFYSSSITQYSLWSFHIYFQVFEIKNDAKMKRTMQRPLPSGRISPAHAAMWATSVGAAGTALLAWKVLIIYLQFIYRNIIL
jgi:heme O synthase-like polyprenyltransferase